MSFGKWTAEKGVRRIVKSQTMLSAIRMGNHGEA